MEHKIPEKNYNDHVISIADMSLSEQLQIYMYFSTGIVVNPSEKVITIPTTLLQSEWFINYLQTHNVKVDHLRSAVHETIPAERAIELCRRLSNYNATLFSYDSCSAFYYFFRAGDDEPNEKCINLINKFDSKIRNALFDALETHYYIKENPKETFSNLQLFTIYCDRGYSMHQFQELVKSAWSFYLTDDFFDKL